MNKPTRVLDAYAIMAFLEDEPGSAQVAELLKQAVRDEMNLAVTVVNLGEVYYSIARTNNLEIAEQMIAEFTSLPVQVMDVDWKLSRQAAVFKAGVAIAYGDCFSAALAYLLDCPLVTGDHEFGRLAQRISVEWIS